ADAVAGGRGGLDAAALAQFGGGRGGRGAFADTTQVPGYPRGFNPRPAETFGAPADSSGSPTAVQRALAEAAGRGGRGGRGGGGGGGGGGFGGRGGRGGAQQGIPTEENRKAGGFGVRVVHSGVWGFASSPYVTEDEIRRVTRVATEVARASAIAKKRDVNLSPVDPYV